MCKTYIQKMLGDGFHLVCRYAQFFGRDERPVAGKEIGLLRRQSQDS